jgi:hypothetical protein
MVAPDDLSQILDRIANGEETDLALLRQPLWGEPRQIQPQT